jgi:acetyl-CoA C-acetyltransferase
MRKAAIVAAKRTAIGNVGGWLSTVPAANMAAEVLRTILTDTGVAPKQIDEVIIGNVVGAGLGQNVARQVAVAAGVPVEVPSFTVDKVCASGLKAVTLGSLMIRAGEADIIVAGGTENMSRIPYAVPSARFGAEMGDAAMVDLLIHDGLWDIFNGYHMGMTAENIAEKYSITREEMDAYAAMTQNRAEKAIEAGKFNNEIAPIGIPNRKGKIRYFDKDEFPRSGVTAEALSVLKPAFTENGKVTSGSSSGINDGAAVLLLMSEEKAAELRLTPMGFVKSYASAGVDPAFMGYAPVPATAKALKKAGWTLRDIELAELNEAFSAQVLAVFKGFEEELGGIDRDIVNVNGGSIALGHPIGAAGARILTTLLHEMVKRDNKKGLAAICLGGGQGMSILIERP